jgi:hypothetical protein
VFPRLCRRRPLPQRGTFGGPVGQRVHLPKVPGLKAPSAPLGHLRWAGRPAVGQWAWRVSQTNIFKVLYKFIFVNLIILLNTCYHYLWYAYVYLLFINMNILYSFISPSSLPAYRRPKGALCPKGAPSVGKATCGKGALCPTISRPYAYHGLLLV